MMQKLKQIKTVEEVRKVNDEYIITSSVEIDKDYDEFQKFQEDVLEETGEYPTPCDVNLHDWIVSGVWDKAWIREDLVNFYSDGGQEQKEELLKSELLINDDNWDINDDESYIVVSVGKIEDTWENDNDTRKYLLNKVQK